MQITRPVMQRGSSAPGVLWPSGTPASHPEPLFAFGVVGLVVGRVEGAVVGFVLGADDELDDGELPVGTAAELLLGTDVGVGAGALDEDDAAVVEVSTPAAAC